MENNFLSIGILQWKYGGIVFRALLFALIISCPKLFAYFSLPVLTPYTLNDTDEITYLRRATDIGKGLMPESYYNEYSKPLTDSNWKLLQSQPSALVDIVFGSLARILDCGPVELGIVLDLLCCFFGYLAFWGIFRMFLPSFWYAEFAGIVALTSSWCLSPDYYYSLPIPFVDWVVSASFTETRPIIRGIYTQVSLPVFALSIMYCTRSCLYPSERGSGSFKAGIYSGTLAHIYFFAWLSSLTIIPFILFFHLIYSFRIGDNYAHKVFFKKIGCFLVGHFTIAALGVAAMVTGGRHNRIIKSAEIGEYWYFSIEVFLFLVLFLVIFFRSKRIDYGILLNMIVCALIAQIILFNLQPLLSSGITSFRFAQLYLQPLYTGSFVTCLILQNLNNGYRKLVNLINVILVFSIVSLFVRKVIWVSTLTKEKYDGAQLVEFITQNTQRGSVIGIISFEKPFMDGVPKKFMWRTLPNLVNTLTDRHILHQNWTMSSVISDKEIIKRELFLGWLYSGEVKLLFPCVSDKIELPGDLFNLTWTIHQIQRREMCKLSEEILRIYTPCDMITEFKLDYVLWEKHFNLEKAPTFEKYMTHLWTSSNGAFELYKFNTDVVREKLCSDNHKLVLPS